MDLTTPDPQPLDNKVNVATYHSNPENRCDTKGFRLKPCCPDYIMVTHGSTATGT